MVGSRILTPPFYECLASKTTAKKTAPRDFPQDNAQILTGPLSFELVELIFPQFF
jgi:hypothetical protein